MFSAFIAAFANALEVTADKIMLGKKELNFKTYLTIGVTFIFVWTLLPMKLFGWLKPEFFSTNNLLAFAGIIICAFFYNYLFFYALSKGELCDVEPLVLINRPVTVIMAALFFPSERSFYPLVFTLIATAALIFSRVGKKHLKMKRETLALVGFIFLISIENLLVKIILPVISPVTLYGLRVAILSILFFLFLRPKVKGVRRNQYLEMFIIGSFTAIEYIFHYYAIGYIGIVQTALISLLGPVLILFFSKFFLKEKLTLKKALADAIIILCVAAVYLIH